MPPARCARTLEEMDPFLTTPSLESWLSPTQQDASTDPRGRRVFVRADLNVPIRDGKILDDSRIRASLPTLRRLREAGARIVLASHLGRPGGERIPDLSLRPVARALADLLGSEVAFAGECVGEGVETAVRELGDGEILLLENLRFHGEETRNDPEFARALARSADLYVNDAFGTAHRAHASTVGIVAHLESAVAGDLMCNELKQLRLVLEPATPLLCLLGGAKVSDKLGVLQKLSERADVLAVGGAMAYTFLAALGDAVGNSRVEKERIEDAQSVLSAAKESGCRLLLPSDHRVSKEVSEDPQIRVVESIPEDWLGVDIGPETAARYAEEADRARTIFWNGPMGIFEIKSCARGTEEVAQAVAKSSATSVVGGGDSLAAIQRLGLGAEIGHLSTGGGASLEFIQGIVLPGVAALEK